MFHVMNAYIKAAQHEILSAENRYQFPEYSLLSVFFLLFNAHALHLIIRKRIMKKQLCLIFMFLLLEVCSIIEKNN